MTFKVSVVIPCYNYGKFVAKAIDSVLAQAGVDVDVIVVDDGSTDGSLEILQSYKCGIRVFQQQHQGVSQARNRGIQEAKSPWITFLDADDWLLEDSLFKRCLFLENNPEIDWVYGLWKVADSHGEIIGTSQEFFPHPDGVIQGDIFPNLIKGYAGVNTLTPLFRLADVRAVGGYRTKYKALEDYDFLLRMAFGKQVGFCPDASFGVQRLHDSHLSSDYELCYKSQITLLKDYRKQRGCDAYLKATFRDRVANLYNYLACIHSEKKRLFPSLLACVSSIAYKPVQLFAYRFVFYTLIGCPHKAIGLLKNAYIDRRAKVRRENGA